MSKKARAFAFSGALALLAVGGVAPALANRSRRGLRAASRSSGVEYKGKTSQGLAFTITVNGKKVTANINYNAKCKSGPLKDIKSGAYGTGKVKGNKFTATGSQSFPGGKGYAAIYKLKAKGTLSSTQTEGSFTVTDAPYNVTTGKTVGSCSTGKQTFKGHKA